MFNYQKEYEERKECADLRFENEQLKFQNRLLRELLEKHNIDIPKEYREFVFIDSIGKDAYIYEALSLIDKRIDMTNKLIIDLLFK